MLRRRFLNPLVWCCRRLKRISPTPLFCVCVCVSFVARFRVLYWGGGGGPLVLLSALFYVFLVIYPFMYFGCFFLFSSLCLLSLLFLFALFRFCVLSLSLLPLLVLFLCLLLFPLLISGPFLCLLCSLFFLRLFFSYLFLSSSSSLSFPFWFLLLLSPLAPLSRLSLPFLLLLPFLLFLLRLPPLFSLPLSSPFLSFYPLLPFLLAILPSRLSSLPLWWFPLLPLAFLSLAFAFSQSAFLGCSGASLCFSCWCFRSRSSLFGPVSLSSLLISRQLLLVPLLLLLLSSSRLFRILPLLCFFFLFLLLLGSFQSPLLLCLSLRLLFPRLRSISLLPLFLSLLLFGSAGGGLSPA